MHVSSRYLPFSSLYIEISPPDRSNIKIVKTKENGRYLELFVVDIRVSVCYAYFLYQVTVV